MTELSEESKALFWALREFWNTSRRSWFRMLWVQLVGNA